MVYDFVCKSCNKKFSINLKMGETIGFVKCPHCGSTNTVRKYYPVSIHFKAGKAIND